MKRKSLLFLLLFALIAPWAAMGQETLTVYESETGTNSYIPIYGLWADANQQSEFIIPASELEDLANGTITQMTFHLSQQANKVWNGTAQVYLREVEETSFSSMNYYGVSGSELVYDGALDAYTTNEMVVPFNSTYTYGGGNLLVGFIWTTGGNYGSAYFYGKTDATNASISHYGSNSPSAKNFIPRTTFEYTPAGGITCNRPTNVAVSYEGSIATATWDGEASLYNIDVNGDVTNGVTSPYTFAVEPQTTYSVKVQADCGSGDLSSWASAPSFTTPCAAFALPYEYGFEDAGDMECWSMVDCAGSTGRTTTASYVHEGSAAFCFVYNTNPPQYLISPMFEGTETGLGVSFYYMNPSGTYTETFQVGYSTTTNETSAFTWGTEITASNANANTWFYYEDAFPAGAKFVAVKLNSYDQLRLCLDDFTFEVPSSCRKPTDLNATVVGKRNATIRWTENGEATAWQVEVTDLDGGQITTWNANATTFEIVGLTPDTRYSVRVNPVCDVEKWSDAITFTTEVACPAPELTIVESTPLATTFSWTGEAQGYEMEYMVNPSFTFEDGTLQGWTNLIVEADGGQWLHSNDNPGGYMDPTASGNPYYPDLAHNGTGFAMCYSFIDNDGAYNTNAYLVSPRSYQISAGASMNFWYDMANDNYPEYFEVCVATAANPTADDFTAIWTSDAKGSNGQKAAVRHRNTRYQNWREVTIDLSAYAGQTIWIAFHDVNEDMYEVWIDDVMIDDGTIEWTSAPAPIVSPYTLALEPGTEYLVRVRAICGGEDGESAWTTVTVTTPSNCDAPTALNVTNLMPTTATLNWTGYQDGFEIQYREVGGYSAIWEDGFEDGLGNWTIYTEADVVSGQTQGWYQYDPTNGLSFEAHGGSYVASAWSWTNSTSYTADNWLVSPQLQLQGILRYYVRTNNNYPDNYEVILSLGGNTVADFTDASAITLVELAAAPVGNQWVEVTIDMSEYTGQSGYIAIHQDQYDGNYLLIDDFGLYEITNPGPWTPATTGDLFVDIDELHPETAYEWQVRGENRSCGEEGYTEWSEMGTFTTPGECDNPNTFVFENLEATTATLTWTGYQESFNVMYRTAETYDELFYDDLEEGIDEWTTPNDDNLFTLSFTDGSSMTCYGFVGDGTTQTMISPEFESAPAGYALRFFYYAYQASIQTFNVGFSTDGENFTYTGEVTTDEENYVDYYEVNVPEGAKYFAIQSSGASNYLLLGDFWIYANYVAPGEWVELTVNEPSVTMEPLVPGTLYEVYVQGICGEEEYTEAVGGYFTTPAFSQTIELTEGWNWFSTYIELEDPVELLTMLQEGMGDSGIQIENVIDGVNMNVGDGYWAGDLDGTGLLNEHMYMIEVSEDVTVELQGPATNPENHEITLYPGDFSWIGFPCAEEVDVNVALAGLEPEEGDYIENDVLGVIYYYGEWVGDFDTMIPGRGYMYFSNSTDEKPLIFQTGEAKAKHSANPASSQSLNSIKASVKHFMDKASKLSKINSATISQKKYIKQSNFLLKK